MASNYDGLEPEERKQVFEDIDYNPLDEAVNEKTYSQGNATADAADLSKPIAEPSFAPPPINTRPPQEPKKREPINPEMNNLSKKDTEMAAGHMAKMLLDGYSWMHTMGNKALVVSEKKLNKLQSEGELNLNAMIDYDYGKKIPAGEFFREYNQQVGQVLTVSDEFKEEVTPVLERVLAKRGVGMTDEQLLMFMFGKDIAMKSLIFVQQKSQLNQMIQSIKEATVSQFAEQAPRPQPQPQPQSQPQQQQQSQPEPEYTQTEEYQQTETPKSSGGGIKPDIIVLPKKRRGRPKL